MFFAASFTLAISYRHYLSQTHIHTSTFQKLQHKLEKLALTFNIVCRVKCAGLILNSGEVPFYTRLEY